MTKKSVLIFTPNNPFPPRHGSHHRVVQQLFDLSSSYKIILTSSYSTTDTPWPESVRERISLCNENNIDVLCIYEDSLFYKTYQFFYAFLRRLYQLTNLPLFLLVSSSLNYNLMRLWLQSINHKYAFSAIIIHYSRWAFLARGIRGPTKAIELHDILPLNKFLSSTILNLLEKKSCVLSKLDYPFISYINDSIQIPLGVKKEIQRDIKILNQYDLIWMISESEDSILKRFGLRTKSMLIHPSVNILPSTEPKDLGPIIPVGPNCFNAYSLLIFINKVLPLIDPEIWNHNTISVSGDFGVYSSRVTLNHPLHGIGFVDDYKKLLLRSSLMIVPTAVGTGQQIKIYEALAAGTPVISYRSSITSDLLARCPSIIAVETHQQFAESLSSFLSDSSMRRKYYDLAYSFALEQHLNFSKKVYTNSLAKACMSTYS